MKLHFLSVKLGLVVSTVVVSSTALATGLKYPEDPNLRRAAMGASAVLAVDPAKPQTTMPSPPPVQAMPSPPVPPVVTSPGQNQSGGSPVSTIFPLAPAEPPAEPGEDDVGTEDDLDAIEAGSVCLEPECLGDIDFEIFTQSQKHDLDIVNSALIQRAFEKYSTSDQIKSLISHARENIRTNPGRYIQRRRGQKAKAFCYRAVKDALKDSGMIPTVFNGGAHAYAGVKDLKPMGFENLLDDPELRQILQNNPRMAPKGTILVFETVPGARVSPSGHIEIKTQDSGTDGYISISESAKPTYGYRIPQQRRLVGVLYKKNLN